MFETVQAVLTFCVAVATAVSTGSAFVVAFLKNMKNKRLAAIAKKTNEISELAKARIMDVENLYSQANDALKASGIKTGELKKENVMCYLEGRCADKGVKFDPAYWSEQIESLIKIMNIKKQPKQQKPNQ